MRYHAFHATGQSQSIGDWFGGAATTGYVAQKLDRSFVILDRELSAIECAKMRLENAGNQIAAAGAPPRDITLYLESK